MSPPFPSCWASLEVTFLYSNKLTIGLTVLFYVKFESLPLNFSELEQAVMQCHDATGHQMQASRDADPELEDTASEVSQHNSTRRCDSGEAAQKTQQQQQLQRSLGRRQRPLK